MPYHLELQQILQHPKPQISNHLISLMIEPLEGVEALLLEACKLAKETSDVENFDSTFFEDFVKAEGNYNFINKNLFLDDNSNQNSDWEDIFQDFPMYQGEDTSFDTNSEEPMDIGDNQPRSCKCRSLQVITTIVPTVFARIKLIKILKSNFYIPCQQWHLDRLLTTFIMY